MKDLYGILGIERDADAAAVKRAYRAKVREVHPDKPGGSQEAFNDAKLAYDVLSDETRRRHYDETGETPPIGPSRDSALMTEEIIMAMRQVILGLYREGAKVKHQKLPRLVADALCNKRGEVTEMLKVARGAMEQYQSAAKRIRRRHGFNLLGSIATNEAADCAKQIDSMVAHEKILGEAIELVLSHDFDQELFLADARGHASVQYRYVNLRMGG